MDVIPDNRVDTIEKTSQQRETSKWTRISSAIKEYTGQSTLHGIGYVFHGGSKPRRFTWLVFLLICIMFCIYSTWTLSSRFLTYPVATKNKIVNADRMLFPAVTICNFNRLLQSKTNSLWRDIYKNKYNADFARIFAIFGHTMEEDGMLVKCMWKGMKCNSSNFYSTVEELGLCHTFNPGRLNTSFD